MAEHQRNDITLRDILLFGLFVLTVFALFGAIMVWG